MKKVTQEEKAHQSTDSALRWKQVRFQELAKRPLMKYILSVSRSLKEGTELKRYHGCWLEWNTKYTHSSFSLISGRLLTGHKNNMAQPKADKWLSSPGIKIPRADKWLSSPGIKTPRADKWLSSPGLGAGIAQWLEHRTRDWKVAGSNPCWNGGRIFFSRVDFLCWLLFRYPFHPRVTAVACKKSRSFCQKVQVAGYS